MSYTRPAPLRRSTDWSQYPADYLLPVVYGRVMLTPQPYDGTGNLWFLADHAIEAVESVWVDGTETGNFLLQNGTDDTGSPIAVLEIGNAVDDRDKLRVRLRGKRHHETGRLLDRPDLVLHDWLVNLCGIDLQVSDFDSLRSWAQNVSVTVGGVIDEPGTVQAVTDRMAQGMGLAWSPVLADVAMPWPPESIGAARAIENNKIDHISAKTSIMDMANIVTVNYADSHADGKPLRSVTARADTTERFGERRMTLDAGWLQSTLAAEALALRSARWYGGGIVRIDADLVDAVMVGEQVELNHPLVPAVSGVITGTVTGDVSTRAGIEAAAGSNVIAGISARSSSVDMDAGSGEAYQYQNGILTYRVMDESQRPVVGAKVTLGGATRRTDGNGYVQFKVEPGDYMLKIEAPGYVEQTVFISL